MTDPQDDDDATTPAKDEPVSSDEPANDTEARYGDDESPA
jgi:hypothetical protein